ncbi:putative lipid-binding transport protein (Tim44 family) [Rhodoligotrophos appendicifer]|uniref:Tim44 domain-containing protein n=1 Tax=Rhodoligotrophos appendicifer TaxID=987056 RepID=UPI001FE6C10D|nr:TIM44-like domain-containing protein [Rhodoligotrophos appendicifer]
MLVSRSRNWVAALLVAMTFGVIMVDVAEARRGGSFGSRGSRTFQAPPTTNALPRQTAPVDRSMTPRTQTQAQPGAMQAQAQRPGLFGGMAGGLLGGLALGGLIGMLMGNGLGGMTGFLGLLLQLGLVFLVVSFLMRRFRGQQAPAVAGGAPMYREQSEPQPWFDIGRAGTSASAAPKVARSQWANDEVGITETDLDTFEHMLTEIQSAFGREDYARLRELTTPEIMSYMSEELSQNAVQGLRNEVTDVKLLQGDIAEAWSEDGDDYATVAMHYSSKDAMVERESGRVVGGTRDEATETGEMWTFVRPTGGEWKLSAIQEA